MRPPHLIATALARGLRRRCPHCGRGPLFSGWATHLERCDRCGLVFEPNSGDTWAFTILLDRIPLGLLVVLVYFSVFRTHRTIGYATFVAIALAFVVLSPNRWGFGIAVNYLQRVYWPEPGDSLPPFETAA
jgi:uncharacterized protein (DUF983 family)